MKKKYEIFPVLLVCFLYFAISWHLFDKIYNTSKIIIDELFHIPQGLAYCQLDFQRWDPKITTLPGLYFTSTLLCKFLLNNCTSSCLRLTNLLASCINFILFYLFRRKVIGDSLGKAIVSAFNLSILPPLYFYGHVYYTDVLSVTAVMGVLFAGVKRRYFMFAILGGVSILYRQTNVVWVAFVSAYTLCGLFFNRFHKCGVVKNQEKMSAQSLRHFIHLPFAWNYPRLRDIPLIFEIFVNLLPLIGFTIFIYFNGGITVGDKQAHSATINLPQMFYFSVFTVFFTWGLFIRNLQDCFMIICNNKMKIFASLLTVSIIVYFNTVVHPYLLADNRHIIFYVWNRFLNTYIRRICWVPIYVIAVLLIVIKTINRLDVRFMLTFFPFLIPGLCFQGLLEVRYFLIPFIIFRLFINTVNFKELYIEFCCNITVNLFFFLTFFRKEVVWPDFEDIQRIIW